MIQSVIALILRFLFRYARSAALAFVVLPTLLVLLVTYLPLVTEAHFEWFIGKLLSLMHISELNVSLGTEEILRIFGTVTFYFFLLVELLRLCGFNVRLSFKRGIAIICIIYVTSIGVGLLQAGKPDMVPVLILCGVVSVVSYTVWYVLGLLPRVVSQIRPMTKEEFEAFQKEHPKNSGSI